MLGEGEGGYLQLDGNTLTVHLIIMYALLCECWGQDRGCMCVLALLSHHLHTVQKGPTTAGADGGGAEDWQ